MSGPFPLKFVRFTEFVEVQSDGMCALLAGLGFFQEGPVGRFKITLLIVSHQRTRVH